MNDQTRSELADIRESPLTRGADSFVSKIADRLGAVAKAETVFGQPVQRGDVTVIPVAKVRWGFGGGEGSGSANEHNAGSGSGGGGGMMATPAGFIEIRDGKAKYQPIVEPAQIIPLAFGAAVIMILVVGRVLKALRAD